jgi:hypothetical protein
MIRLDLNRESNWLDRGHGVRLHVRPCTTALVMAARPAVARGVNAEPDDQAAGTLTGLSQDPGPSRCRCLGGCGQRRGQAGCRHLRGRRGADGPLADRGCVRAAVPRARAAAGRGKKRLRARAEWHFGGGVRYCDGCARQGRTCARGELGSDGELCPYIANEPATDAGWPASDVLLRCSGQLRVTHVAAIGNEQIGTSNLP